jgi:iron complex transport system ATP-binding protein
MANSCFPIQSKSLSIGYQKDTPVLSGINLTAASGDLTGLVGRNGIGKTTLLRTLSGLLKPLDGQIFISGIPLPGLSALERAKRLSFLSFFRQNIPNLRVFDLVAMGRAPHTNWYGRLSKKDEAAVFDAIEKVELQRLKHRSIAELSDGEFQRTLIARSLSQDTPVIILDEPVAFLDLPHKISVLRLLRQIAATENKSILISIHDVELAFQECDRIWLLSPEQCMNGAPEDICRLKGFGSLFEADWLWFDPQLFRFQSSPTLFLPIHLTGDLQDDPWLQHTLQRVGFSTSPMTPNIPVLSLSEERWLLEWKNKRHLATSMYELAGLLQDYRKKRICDRKPGKPSSLKSS